MERNMKSSSSLDGQAMTSRWPQDAADVDAVGVEAAVPRFGKE
jgi:hypothetical protein